MENLLSPYKGKYNVNVKKHYFQPKPPAIGDVDKTIKLSENLYLHELVSASFVRPEEKNLFTYIPVDIRIIKAFKILRKELGSSITVTSFFRSQRHELHKKRSGTSKHTDGQAIDLTGKDLVDLISNALETKNKLYQDLRAAGVNGFGVYKDKNFVHLDVRKPNWLGTYAFWTGTDNKEPKKKGLSVVVSTIGIIVAVPLVIYGVFKMWKRRKKKK